MIGLGTQDDLNQAKSFQKRNKVSTVKLLWDSTGKSWTKLGVPAQPAWMLIAADGTVLGTDLGAIPYEEVLAEI